MRSEDLILYQVVLEVFVRNIAVSVYVKVPEDLKCLGLATTEGNILNFLEQTTEPACLSLVLNRRTINAEEFLVDEGWRWVGSLSDVQGKCQLVCILLKDKGCD